MCVKVHEFGFAAECGEQKDCVVRGVMRKTQGDLSSLLPTLVFLRRPLVPVFWPSMGLVGTSLTCLELILVGE